MWKYRIIYIAVVITAGIMYIWVNEKQALLLLILLVLLPALSGILAWFQVRFTTLVISMQKTCVMGQRVSICFHLERKGGIFGGRVTLPFTLKNLMFQKSEKKLVMMDLGTRKEVEFYLPLETELCGRLQMQCGNLRCYDTLGLFCFKKAFRDSHVLTIYPKIHEVSLVLDQRPKTVESGEMYDQRRKGQDTSEIFDMRDYREGDSIRKIHWKLSSKRDKLVVREFSRPVNYHTILLFDLAYFYGQEKVSKQVISQIVCLVASISSGLLKNDLGHEVGCMQGKEFVHLAVNSEETFMELLSNLTSMTVHEQVPDMMQAFIQMELYRQYTKVIYITGKLEESLMGDLGNLVSLSVLVLWEGKGEYLDSSKEYDITSLSVEELGEHIIHLYL